MATPIPIAIYGQNAAIAAAVREKLLPDIDVVHTCLTPSQAESELSALCAGDLSTNPTSGLGSNFSAPDESSRRVPAFVGFGGGISEEEIERVQRLVRERQQGQGQGGAGEEGKETKFLRITRDKVLAAGAKGPDAEVIAGLYRRKVAEL